MAKKQTSTTQRGQVKLREKKLTDGSSSLYLDIYSNGKRVKEYLKLYLVVPNTAIEKEQNRQTLAVANSMRAKRELDLFSGKYEIGQPKQEGVRFLDFYRQMCEERLKTPDTLDNWGNWHNCLKHLEIYCDEFTTFDDIDAAWIQGFKDYLNTAEKDGNYVIAWIKFVRFQITPSLSRKQACDIIASQTPSNFRPFLRVQRTSSELVDRGVFE